MEFLPALDDMQRLPNFMPLITQFQASNQLDDRIAGLVKETGVTPRTLKEIPDEIYEVRANGLEREKRLKEWAPIKSMTEDERVKEFGTEEGKPVDKGFVFFDGRFLEPPYTVTRRGLAFYINNIRVWDCPIEYPEGDQEPDLPSDMSKDWNFDNLQLAGPNNVRWDLRECRWIESHFGPEEAERRITDFYQRRPLGKSVQAEEPGNPAEVQRGIYDWVFEG